MQSNDLPSAASGNLCRCHIVGAKNLACLATRYLGYCCGKRNADSDCCGKCACTVNRSQNNGEKNGRKRKNDVYAEDGQLPCFGGCKRGCNPNYRAKHNADEHRNNCDHKCASGTDHDVAQDVTSKHVGAKQVAHRWPGKRNVRVHFKRVVWRPQPTNQRAEHAEGHEREANNKSSILLHDARRALGSAAAIATSINSPTTKTIAVALTAMPCTFG